MADDRPISELTVVELQAKVDNGIAWLSDHDRDPPGRFYLWFKGGLTPIDKMPAQDDNVKERYREWYYAFKYFNELYALLEKRSAASGS